MKRALLILGAEDHVARQFHLKYIFCGTKKTGEARAKEGHRTRIRDEDPQKGRHA